MSERKLGCYEMGNGKNPDNPLVSIIIPCYNGEFFIEEAINSVLSQTYRPIEVIIIDDASSDNSKNIIKNHLAIENLKYDSNASNHGIAYTRNKGIAKSSGSYIAFLDQDDLWYPDKLEKQMSIINRGESEFGLIFSDIVYSDGSQYIKNSWPRCRMAKNINAMNRSKVLESLFLRNFIPLVTALISRQCLNEVGFFDERIKGGADDYDLLLRLVGNYTVFFMDEATAIHRIHAHNYSNDLRLLNDEILIVNKILEQYPQLRELENLKMSFIYERFGNYYAGNGDKQLAIEHFRKASEIAGTNLKRKLKEIVCKYDIKYKKDIYGKMQKPS